MVSVLYKRTILAGEPKNLKHHQASSDAFDSREGCYFCLERLQKPDEDGSGFWNWMVGLRLGNHDLGDVLKVGALSVATAGCWSQTKEFFFEIVQMESIDGG